MIGVVLASVVNPFIAASVLTLAISIVGVLVFTGLTAWDTQRIKQMYADMADLSSMARTKVLGALTSINASKPRLGRLRYVGRPAHPRRPSGVRGPSHARGR